MRGADSPATSGAASARIVEPHIHLHQPDARTMAQALMANNGALVKAVHQAVRHGAHLGLR